MSSLSPSARQRSMLEQQRQHKTRARQMDQKRRNTFNSREDKELLTLNASLLKKKQKTSTIAINEGKDEINIENNWNVLHSELEAKKVSSKMVTESLFSSNTIAPNTTVSDTIFETYQINRTVVASDLSDKENINFESDKKYDAGILGVGHLSALHAYTRDFLFKMIKILSHNHLETNGWIMNKVIEKLGYNEKIDGNFQAFTNACRTEIRKTISS
jgi:hypothetical protein